MIFVAHRKFLKTFSFEIFDDNKNSPNNVHKSQTEINYVFFLLFCAKHWIAIESQKKTSKTTTKSEKFRDYTQYNLTLRLLNSLCLAVSSAAANIAMQTVHQSIYSDE